MTTATIINYALAFMPVLILLAVFAWLDVFHLLNRREMITLIALGGIAAGLSYPVSGRMLDALPLGFSSYSRFVAPWIEEALKGAVVVLLFLRNRIGFKIDAALSGLAIGAGFSLVENCIYLVHAPQMSPGVWMVRGAGTALMHGGTVAIMAALSHQVGEHDLLVKAGEWRPHPLAYIPGYLVAVALHLGFNQFPSQPLVAMVLSLVLVPVLLMAIFSFGAREAGNLLKVESAEHLADLDHLENGRWPDTDSGRRMAAYVADHPELGPAVLEYWRILNQTVLSAERRMLERTHGQWLDREAEQDEARLRRLDALERGFDPQLLRAVTRLLPFSRNDHWEIAELREQLERG
ncbi:PrsW family glutamic-type intramembrane protease [Sphingomonas astaxanthinifaciens]|uniref:PrsW family intramembrane metalloprotease n=1 Tax=Sphingomonas astaxanthinifaciens DSM 22298 TaxID=1123267 RepID=A0ABQ5Z8M7_9SPHN|nr:PrsW family glutamic-type intramembrane protease [Sphingomonas astaxanthinifaciens]GLR48351.1 hypothetical protein GCM10007925_20660 [Sphingomonas astaxanthinifaciens DSM 22298]